jgi:DNA-binding MarR family transcriptional regulator
MPPPRARPGSASLALARVAPLLTRWVERSLAAQSPPLTLAQYLALEQLGRGRVSAAELAQGASISRSAVSQLVASLEGEGLVRREESESDRRQRPLVLSAEGAKVLRSSRRLLRRRLDPLIESLPPHKADALAGSLGLIESVLGGTPPPRRPPHPKRPPAPPAPRWRM